VLVRLRRPVLVQRSFCKNAADSVRPGLGIRCLPPHPFASARHHASSLLSPPALWPTRPPGAPATTTQARPLPVSLRLMGRGLAQSKLNRGETEPRLSSVS
jgi:hypothetical protein